MVGLSACSKQSYYNESGTNNDSVELNVHSMEPTDKLNELLNQEMIHNVKTKMEKQGWENIRIDEGWGNWKAWGEGNAYIPPKELRKDMCMYTLWGTVKGNAKGVYDSPDNSLDIIVQIVFDQDNPNGYIYNVFYTSASGRYLDSDESFNDFLENNEILSTNTESLWNFMYSY